MICILPSVSRSLKKNFGKGLNELERKKKKKKFVLLCKDCWRLWWERLYYFVARRDRTLLIISMTKIKDKGSPPFSRRSTYGDIFEFYFTFLWVKIWWFSLINLCLFVCFDWWCRKMRVLYDRSLRQQHPLLVLRSVPPLPLIFGFFLNKKIKKY